MGLLDDQPAEGVEAQLPPEPEKEEAPTKETKPEEAKAEEAKDAKAEEGAPEEPEEPERKEDQRDKRIKQLTKRLRDAEHDRDAVNARLGVRDKEFKALQEQVDQLTKALTQPEEQPPGEDATPEEIREYYERKFERERKDAETKIASTAAQLRIEGQISALQAVHDGASGPSFDDLRTRYEHIIDQDPRYLREKALIQRDSNPPKKFYEIAKSLWDQDRGELEEEIMTEKDKRAAGSVASATPATRTTRKGKLNDEEKKAAQAIFGDVNVENLEKARAKRLEDAR